MFHACVPGAHIGTQDVIMRLVLQSCMLLLAFLLNLFLPGVEDILHELSACLPLLPPLLQPLCPILFHLRIHQCVQLLLPPLLFTGLLSKVLPVDPHLLSQLILKLSEAGGDFRSIHSTYHYSFGPLHQATWQGRNGMSTFDRHAKDMAQGSLQNCVCTFLCSCCMASLELSDNICSSIFMSMASSSCTSLAFFFILSLRE